MLRKALLLVIGVIFVFSLNGCATTGKNKDLEIQGLRNRVLALETQLREKDDELTTLKEIAPKSEDTALSMVKSETPDAKQIQAALKNAGYYLGPVDGKLGKGTRKAVRKFQEANNLPVDGKVGKNTWAALKGYLDKKVK